MKRHTGHKHMSNEMGDMLRRSKIALPKNATTGQGVSPDSAAAMIATGRITRERSCDGKARFRTYDFAENTVRPSLEQRHRKTYEVYACYFCDGFHLATVGEFAA